MTPMQKKIGSQSLTIHCSRTFPIVIFDTCKAPPMPHIQQDRNIFRPRSTSGLSTMLVPRPTMPP
jgi:hypothetical protein